MNFQLSRRFRSRFLSSSSPNTDPIISARKTTPIKIEEARTKWSKASCMTNSFLSCFENEVENCKDSRPSSGLHDKYIISKNREIFKIGQIECV